MDKEAAGYIHPQDGLRNAGAIRQCHASDQRRERRVQRVLAGLPDHRLHDVQPFCGNPKDIARLVVHPKDQHAAVCVGKGSDFVRNVVLGWPSELAAGEAHLLEFQETVFAKPDLLQQFSAGLEHSDLAAQACPAPRECLAVAFHDAAHFLP